MKPAGIVIQNAFVIIAELLGMGQPLSLTFQLKYLFGLELFNTGFGLFEQINERVVQLQTVVGDMYELLNSLSGKIDD